MSKKPDLLFLALISACIGAFTLSCGAGPYRESETGSVTVSFGTGPSRAVIPSSEWPAGALPKFSTVEIRVSASDMVDVVATASGVDNTVSLEVPAGKNRRVDIRAVADWEATAAAYPDAPLPTFAKAYGGSAKVDVEAGKTVSAAVTLVLAESKILLPDPTDGFTLKIANDLSSSGADEIHMLDQLQISNISDFEFDNRGYLYISGANIYRYALIGGVLTPQLVIEVNTRNLAFDAPRNRMYGFHQWQTPYLAFFNVAENVVTQYEAVLTDNEYQYYSPGSVAVDKDGFVYVVLWKWIDVEVQGLFIAKLSVGEPFENTAEASIVAVADFASLGLMLDESQNLDVRDMTIVDGKLYIAAGLNYDDDYHIGKVVEVRLSDLFAERAFGFSNTNFPTDPSRQFYGPMRFIGVAPNKLIVADEGLVGEDNVDRVGVVDLESGAVDFKFASPKVTNFFVTYPLGYPLGHPLQS